MDFRITMKKRIIAVASTAAIMSTLAPELALPVMAMETRKDILASDISDTEDAVKVPSIDDYDYEMYEYNGHIYAFVNDEAENDFLFSICERTPLMFYRVHKEKPMSLSILLLPMEKPSILHPIIRSGLKMKAG